MQAGEVVAAIVGCKETAFKGLGWSHRTDKPSGKATLLVTAFNAVTTQSVP